MEQILLAERHATARAVPRLALFTLITSASYLVMIAAQMGHVVAPAGEISAFICLVFTCLIIGSSLSLLDQVRYADKYRAENARGQRL